MTYNYIKKGRMSQRPYHLLADDGETAVCGAVNAADEDAQRVVYAPNPINDWLICLACREKAAHG